MAKNFTIIITNGEDSYRGDGKNFEEALEVLAKGNRYIDNMSKINTDTIKSNYGAYNTPLDKVWESLK